MRIVVINKYLQMVFQHKNQIVLINQHQLKHVIMNDNKQVSSTKSPFFPSILLFKLDSRSKQTTSASNTKQNQSSNTKPQSVWRPLSPSRPLDPSDPTPQEAISYKSQQRTNLNENKQRYQTATTPIIDTSSIPPLMSVRSDATTTNLYKTANHNYDDDNVYYDSNLDQNYHHTNLHNRRYTALGTYGRYRRSGTIRHQQQYTSYNINNTSGISSAPNTSSGTRQKKNTNNKKSTQSSEQVKPLMTEEIKPIETSLLSPSTEVLPSDAEKLNDTSEKKFSNKNINESNVAVLPVENDTTKMTKRTKIVTPSNIKRNSNKNQQNYHQDQHYQNQQAPRHRNNYSRSMQGILIVCFPFTRQNHRFLIFITIHALN